MMSGTWQWVTGRRRFGAWCWMAAFLLGPAIVCGQQVAAPAETSEVATPDRSTSVEPELAKATFGSGCFWCTEAIFLQLKGVHSVVSGYCGGRLPNPTYEQVLTGMTGHAEVVQITYDPRVINFQGLLQVFWQTHDPTTLNRQGNDIGTQYRSVIFFHDAEQQKLAEHFRTQLNATGAFGRPVVTEISPLDQFYPAEDYHQNYYERNKRKSYCKFVIAPKLDKFKKVFKEHLKTPETKSR
jgi:peptide-methionine (S)-S-oxide reductase